MHISIVHVRQPQWGAPPSILLQPSSTAAVSCCLVLLYVTGDFTAARLTLQPQDPTVMAAIAASAAAAAKAEIPAAVNAGALATGGAGEVLGSSVGVHAAAAEAAPAACLADARDVAGSVEETCAAAATAVIEAQGCFLVTMPPSQLGSSAKYVMLQSRFLPSLANSWQVGDRVQVCCIANMRCWAVMQSSRRMSRECSCHSQSQQQPLDSNG